MKKSLIAFLLVFALAITALAVGGGALLDWQDDLDVQEETVLGDISAAEGLRLHTRAHHRSYFLWETAYSAAKDPGSQTGFSYYYTSQDYQRPGESEAGLNSKSMFFTMSGGGLVISSNDDLYTKPAVDVALRTGINQTHTETVRLKDYYDYHTVELEVDYSREFLSDLDLLHSVYSHDNYNLTEFFKIPVSEDIRMEISVTKDAKGNLSKVSSDPPENQKSEYDYGLHSDGVVTNDAVWFALTPLDAQSLDLSQLKLGYGLYRVPLEKYQRDDRATLQIVGYEIENVWPVDYPNALIRSVDRNEDGTKLFVLTKEPEGFFMNVLSAADDTVIARIEMEEMSPYLVRLVDNLVVLVSFDQQKQQHRIVAYDLQSHEKWLDAELPVDQDYDMQKPAFAFDGERLAVADFRRGTASVQLVIYGPEGMRYMGRYHNAEYHFDTDIKNSLSLTWQ